jgi:hypothetical protein
MSGFYQAMVEAAADRAADTDTVDLVDLAQAASAGFDPTTFAQDVTDELSARSLD